MQVGIVKFGCGGWYPRTIARQNSLDHRAGGQQAQTAPELDAPFWSMPKGRNRENPVASRLQNPLIRLKHRRCNNNLGPTQIMDDPRDKGGKE